MKINSKSELHSSKTRPFICGDLYTGTLFIPKYGKAALFFLLFLITTQLINAQSTINSINQASYDNYAENYNYTYWGENWLTSGAPRSFANHTSKYAIDIDYTNLNVNSLLISDSLAGRKQGFHAIHSVIFPNNYQGDISYAILQNDTVKHEKSGSPTSTGRSDCQLAEFGVWRNTRFVSANHNNGAPVDAYFTGLEFSTWHDRFKLTYHVKPTSDILNGRLRFTFNVPAAYSQYNSSNGIHAFGLPSDKGFAIKGGTTTDSVAVSGNQITIFSAQQDLIANESYEISLIFYALSSNLAGSFTTAFNQEDTVQITGNQVAPSNSNITDISYDADHGVHFVKIPRVNMGYFNCGLVDRQQRINLTLTNPSNELRRVRLCIYRQPNINVTGFNSLICNSNGDPSGLPLQISKNWHTTTPQIYSGSWINEYTEIMLPANTTLNFQYKSTGAKWGETYSASSHQLSVAGAGVPRGSWLEAALGTFGENITHSPDYEYGRTNGADVRPFLVTNEAYGGTSQECGWTGNVGGIDMCVYYDANNARRYQSQVKIDFKKYSPNLTETSVSAVSSDQKLKLDYTFYLNRSDDYNRIYYKLKIKALQNVPFNRFDIFQLGGDHYNIHNTQLVAYGNDTGRIAQLTPTNDGSNGYTTARVALEGNNPWLWAGDGLNYTGASSGIDIDCNNGMIIRDYQAVFNGISNNTPFFRERSSGGGFSGSHGTNPTSYCLVPPEDVSSFAAGDSIELLVEVVIFPKQPQDYYGPNQNFANALATHGNSYELLFREAQKNKINASSTTHALNTQFPLTVTTIANEAIVDITGGVGYVPVIFSGLTEVDDPQLWRMEGDCWQLVDQSVHGKDFWQSEYNENTGFFDVIYNVNQDRPNDSTAYSRFYLGDTPPASDISLFGIQCDTICQMRDSIRNSDYFVPKVSHLAGGFSGPAGKQAAFGTSLHFISDLDGNGVEDILVGAPFATQINSSGKKLKKAGAVYVLLLGSDRSVISEHEISIESSDIADSDLHQNAYFGSSVTDIGDMNEDGINDIAVGAPGLESIVLGKKLKSSGGFFLLYMNSNGSVQSYNKIFASNTTALADIGKKYLLGSSLTSTDVNGDGLNDIIAGAPGANNLPGANKLSRSGEVVIIVMNSDGTVNYKSRLNADALQPAGLNLQKSAMFGSSIDVLSENNFVVGLPGYTWVNPNGKKQKSTGAFASVSVDNLGNAVNTVLYNPDVLPLNLNKGDKFGAAITTLPGFVEPSKAAVLVGAPLEDQPEKDAGSLYAVVIDGDSVSYALELEEPDGATLGKNDRFGSSVDASQTFYGCNILLAAGAPKDDDLLKDAGAYWYAFLQDATPNVVSKVGSLNRSNILHEASVEQVASEVKALWNVEFHPNPVREMISIYFNSQSELAIHLQIFDQFGRTVLTQSGIHPAGNSSHKINLSMLPVGLYTIRINDKSQTVTAKILLVK